MWWVLLLRLVAVVALILAAAEPVVRPAATLSSSGPVVVIVDDSWAAASGWSVRRDLALGLVSRAEREGRPVILVTTAAGENGIHRPPEVAAIADVRRRLNALQPKPWASDPVAALQPLISSDPPIDKAGRIFWLSDGIDSATRMTDTVTRRALIERLMLLGPVTLFHPEAKVAPLLLRADTASGTTDLAASLERTDTTDKDSHSIFAYDDDGVALGRTTVVFEAGAASARAVFDLPLELRNRVARLAVDDRASAGAVMLLDDRWRRGSVGLVSVGGTGDDQPLLSGQHYIAEALSEANEVRRGSLGELMDSGVPVLVLDDPGTLAPEEAARLMAWIEDGGVQITFAGPRFADAAFSDSETGSAGWGDLLPVQLRQGDRTIGGAMSWRRPATVARFDAGSPFFGLDVPADIRIARQVLAEPDVHIEQRTWAKLSDGTPLVTGDAKGQGWRVLFHVTANAEWSSLPLSGLFVNMLDRLTALSSKSAATSENRILAPLTVLDGFGVLRPVPARVAAISSREIAETVPSPSHPPGYYGDAGERRALNLADGIAALAPPQELPEAIEQRPYVAEGEQPLAPWLFSLVLFLLFVDLLLSLWLRGFFRRHKVATVAGISLLVAALALLGKPMADGDVSLSDLIEAAARTRIAYIETGDRQVDQITEIGLAGLGQVLSQRTTIELASPVAVDPALDELAFYPLIYWPVIAGSRVPTTTAAQRINRYLESGGMILFDAKSTDAAVAGMAGRIADVLDVPRLMPVPEGHVLTRSFYLLSDFPGRWAGRPVWIAPTSNRVNDGVAPVIAGSHDWVAAWAVDALQEPLFAVVPGGERQRELAFRFGVNLMMYALTGNYKADQVHIPAIMQRLGQ